MDRQRSQNVSRMWALPPSENNQTYIVEPSYIKQHKVTFLCRSFHSWRAAGSSHGPLHIHPTRPLSLWYQSPGEGSRQDRGAERGQQTYSYGAREQIFLASWASQSLSQPLHSLCSSKTATQFVDELETLSDREMLFTITGRGSPPLRHGPCLLLEPESHLIPPWGHEAKARSVYTQRTLGITGLDWPSSSDSRQCAQNLGCWVFPKTSQEDCNENTARDSRWEESHMTHLHKRPHVCINTMHVCTVTGTCSQAHMCT